MTEFAIVRWDTYLSKDKSTIYPAIYIKNDKDFIYHFERNKFRMQCKVSDTKTGYDGEQLYQCIILNQEKEIFSGDDKYLRDTSYILIILKTQYIEHVPLFLGKITVVDFNLEEEKKQQEQLAEIVKKSTDNFNNDDIVQKKAKSDLDIFLSEYNRVKNISDNDDVLLKTAQETLEKATKDASDATLVLETEKIVLKKAQDDVTTLTNIFNQLANDSTILENDVKKAKDVSDSATLEAENAKSALLLASNAYTRAQQEADVAIDIANKATSAVSNEQNSNGTVATPAPSPDPAKVLNMQQAVDGANLKINIRENRKQDLAVAQSIVSRANEKASSAFAELNKVTSSASQANNDKQVASDNLKNAVAKFNKELDAINNAFAIVNSTQSSLATATENSRVVNSNAVKNSANTKKALYDLNKAQVVLNITDVNLNLSRDKLTKALENKKNYDDSLKPLVPTITNTPSNAIQQRDANSANSANSANTEVSPPPTKNNLPYIIAVFLFIIAVIILIYIIYWKGMK